MAMAAAFASQTPLEAARGPDVRIVHHCEPLPSKLISAKLLDRFLRLREPAGRIIVGTVVDESHRTKAILTASRDHATPRNDKSIFHTGGTSYSYKVVP